MKKALFNKITLKALVISSSGFFILTLLFSCNRTLDEVPGHLDDIYPLTQGQWRIYTASDSDYASINVVEGRNFYKKELMNGTETDLDGRTLSTLWIYESADSTDSLGSPIFSWEFDILWTQHADDVYAERTEGNTRYLVLKFPPMEGTRWNGNMYNSMGGRTYEVLNHDTTVTVQGVTYDHCVYVLKIPYYLVSFDSYYHREYAYEIYAPGIGKIVRHDEQVEIDNPIPNGYKPKPEKSWYLHEELISHN